VDKPSKTGERFFAGARRRRSTGAAKPTGAALQPRLCTITPSGWARAWRTNIRGPARDRPSAELCLFRKALDGRAFACPFSLWRRRHCRGVLFRSLSLCPSTETMTRLDSKSLIPGNAPNVPNTDIPSLTSVRTLRFRERCPMYPCTRRLAPGGSERPQFEMRSAGKSWARRQGCDGERLEVDRR
jgi:hypothetical protein